MDALLALEGPLDSAAWLDCLERCAGLVCQPTAAVAQRVAALQRLLGGSGPDAAAALTKAPYLLLHESALVEAKVGRRIEDRGRGVHPSRSSSSPRARSARAPPVQPAPKP